MVKALRSTKTLESLKTTTALPTTVTSGSSQQSQELTLGSLLVTLTSMGIPKKVVSVSSTQGDTCSKLTKRMIFLTSTYLYPFFYAEAVKKGTAYLSIFMYVIRELEDALDDCNRGCDRDECNDDAVHALDEAVAFYGGALLGDASSGNGNLLYALAEKRCENFNTCGVDGQSNVNNEIFVQFRKMQDNLLKEDCEAGRVNKDRIVELMYVPMIQGALRYAYFQGEQNDTSEKSEAEGATFAAAVLPIVHACSPVDADAIYDNMRIGETAKADFSVVKAAFENNYDCMGITCEDVGGLYDGADYYPKAAPCGSSKRGDAPVGVIVGVVLGVLAILGLGLMIRSRSSSQVEFKTDGSNPAV